MKNQQSHIITIMAFFLITIAADAQASLLTNGTFDDQDYGIGYGGVRLFNQIDGWTRINGKAIEIQRETLVGADTGEYYTELDGYDNTTISQSVHLTAGSYLLSFAYQPRTNSPMDNGIRWSILDPLGDNDETKTVEGGEVDGTKGEWIPAGWHQFDNPFDIYTEGSYDIVFSAFGKSNRLGGLLDSVNLNGIGSEPVPTPEPGTLFLLGSGLAGIVLYGRKRKFSAG